MFGAGMWERSNSMVGAPECHLRVIHSNKVIEYPKTTTTSHASGEEFLLARLLASRNNDKL
jgi:hypothetical protein